MIRFPFKVLKPVWQYLKKQEKKLLKRKKELEKQDPFADVDRLSSNAPDTDAAEQFGHAQVLAMVSQVNKALIAVRKAMTRIKLGQYGLCKDCQEMIDTDRLAVDPTAEFCLSCAKKRKK